LLPFGFFVRRKDGTKRAKPFASLSQIVPKFIFRLNKKIRVDEM